MSLSKTNKEQTEHINSINGRNRLNINEVVIDIKSTIGNDMVVVDIKWCSWLPNVCRILSGSHICSQGKGAGNHKKEFHKKPFAQIQIPRVTLISSRLECIFCTLPCYWMQLRNFPAHFLTPYYLGSNRHPPKGYAILLWFSATCSGTAYFSIIIIRTCTDASRRRHDFSPWPKNNINIMHTTSVSLWTGNDWMRHVLWHDATRQRDSVDIWSRDEVGCGQTPPV